MSDLIALADSDEKKALLNPHFCELVAAISDIKKNRGINIFDYDSFDDFSMALLSSMHTNQLKLIKRILDSSGIPDETLDAILEERLTNTTMLAVNI